MREIMAFYKPKWVIAVGILSSLATSIQLPLFGYILSKVIFILMEPPESPNFESNRNKYIGCFGVLCFGIGLFTFI